MSHSVQKEVLRFACRGSARSRPTPPADCCCTAHATARATDAKSIGNDVARSMFATVAGARQSDRGPRQAPGARRTQLMEYWRVGNSSRKWAGDLSWRQAEVGFPCTFKGFLVCSTIPLSIERIPCMLKDFLSIVLKLPRRLRGEDFRLQKKPGSCARGQAMPRQATGQVHFIMCSCSATIATP